MFSKRLADLRQKKNISQQDLADQLGISRGRIGNYELGTREPDFDTLSRIADYFSVTTDYLLGKEDETNVSTLLKKHLQGTPMTADEQKALARYMDEINRLNSSPTYRKLNQIAQITARKYSFVTREERMTEARSIIQGIESRRENNIGIPGASPWKQESIRQLPVVGRVSAGPGAYATEDIEEWFPVDIEQAGISDQHLDEYFYLRVVGDSMSPAIVEGDRVVVHRGGQVQDGDIAVVIVDNESGCIKKVSFIEHKDRQYVVMESLNKEYKERVLPLSEVFFVGPVVWRIGPLKAEDYLPMDDQPHVPTDEELLDMIFDWHCDPEITPDEKKLAEERILKYLRFVTANPGKPYVEE